MSRLALIAALVLVVLTPSASAQPALRRVTSIDALRQFPAYFHLQNVLLQGEFVQTGRRILLRGGDRDIQVLLNEERTTTGLAEVRGTLFDVGRLEPGDPRLARYDGSREADQWPRPGEELVLNVTGITPVQPTATPSVRTLALQPWRFERQQVTIVGQFRGRNLFGDVPSAPGISRYDFVLRSADAAIWVTGLRPRGPDFDLSVDARVDTGHWLQVTGNVFRRGGLVGVEASAVSAATAPEAPPPNDEPVSAAPPPEPVEVVFSTPGEREIDVPPASSVRVQFSQGLVPGTLAGQIRVSYVGGTAGGDPQTTLPQFESTYDAGPRAIEIKFTGPLERFRTVKVEFLDGIKALGGGSLTPWTLTFSVGG